MDQRRGGAGLELARDSPDGARSDRRTARGGQQGIRPGGAVDQEQRPRGNQRRGYERDRNRERALSLEAPGPSLSGPEFGLFLVALRRSAARVGGPESASHDDRFERLFRLGFAQAVGGPATGVVAVRHRGP